MGVFYVKGWGPKSSVCPSLEAREIKLFWRDIPGFLLRYPAVPEEFEKKKFVSNFCQQRRRGAAKPGGRGRGIPTAELPPETAGILRPPPPGTTGIPRPPPPWDRGNTMIPPPTPPNLCLSLNWGGVVRGP